MEPPEHLGCEPADVPDGHVIEVKQIEARPRKLRLWNDDLRCQWYGGPAAPRWDGAGYYTSTTSWTIKAKDGTEVSVPAGTHFFIELEEGKKIDGIEVGDYAELTCIDPRNPEQLLSFGYWHAVHDDHSRKFTKVENEMVALAIAATGLVK